ncbi:MAG: hypothetical protein DRO73_07095 [Candidatus Thorarchaeota archaeon]|nr:MAG: hypothetical protein DRO73_07095 [Candidatus Thorarchaeota archaeon]
MSDRVMTDVTTALTRLNTLLRRIEGVVSGLNTQLGMMGHRLTVVKFRADHNAHEGNLPAIVCVPTGMSPNDPLAQSIRQVLSEDESRPTLMLFDDPLERNAGLHVVRYVCGSQRKTPLTTAVNLRWAVMPPTIADNVVVIGTRYSRIGEALLDELSQRLQSYGFTLLEDNREFGGGRVVYTLSRELGSDINVLEVTVPVELAKSPERVRLVITSVAV